MAAPGVYFPAEPGESGVSILDMVARTTGSKITRAIRRLSIQRGLLLYSTLPCRVQRLCWVTEGAYGNVTEVLARHSLLGFATTGMSFECAEQATQNVIFAASSRTKFPRLPVGIEAGNRFGLQCPECALLASKASGRRVSYCMHCIPYVTRCPRHGCRLVCDRECSRLETLLTSDGDGACMANSLRYAELARSVSEDLPQAPLRARILKMLAQKGFVTERGSVRVAEFHGAAVKLFSAGFEDPRLRYMVDDRKIFDACIRAARRPERAIPAPFLVLLWQAVLSVDASTAHHERHALELGSADCGDQVRASKRAQWAAHGDAHANATRTEQRRALPGVWAWLYRHDGEWLQQNQRPTTRPRGGRKSNNVPAFIDAAILNNNVDFREHPGGREPLPSAYQARLAYGMNEYLFNRTPAATCATGHYAQLPGWKEVFINRRVTLAVEQLTRRGEPLDVATVSRAARLRIATVERICSANARKNDSKTIGAPSVGPSYFRGRKVHAVSTPVANGFKTQPFASTSVDATEPNAAGPRTTRKHGRVCR